MEQYPIPQFIESEGKIISFLTFRQFFTLVIGGGACVGFFYLLPFFLFLILSAIVAILVLAIAFLKVDNVSVMTILINYLTFSIGSKNYVWKKKSVAMKNPLMGPVPAVKGPHEQDSKLKNAKKMVEYRKKSDTK
ncbi:PrgI family protein [Candidatus Parcubacteria bacterium]|nr:PrgI family protein [Candidatus Parcubacteria bacterium]